MPSHQDDPGMRFNAHIVEKAMAARARYGPRISPEAILAMLDDREVVRYPVSVVFDAGPLQPHEFAWPKALGFHPSDGYVLFVHSHFEDKPESLPLLIAYHIPGINYGPAATAEQAELYATTLLDMDPERYYRALCAAVDDIPGRATSHVP